MRYKDLQTFTEVFYRPQQQAADNGFAYLFVIGGPLNGTSFSLESRMTTAGRLSDNAICISSKSVSKRHCQIDRERKCNYYITDLNSVNGTELNGRFLKAGERVQLTNGDTIRICDTSFFFINQGSSTSIANAGNIKVDIDKASKEAEDILSKCQDITALRKQRKDKGK